MAAVLEVRGCSKMADIRSPAKAIRAFCIECMGGNSNYVRECTTTSCSLHPFRFGKNPYRTPRQLTEEQKQAAAERLRAVREAKTKEAQYE